MLFDKFSSYKKMQRVKSVMQGQLMLIFSEVRILSWPLMKKVVTFFSEECEKGRALCSQYLLGKIEAVICYKEHNVSLREGGVL